ncbi:helix-turn-helix transcriptional regulator [Paraburkholderia sp. Se-20369]|nr:helix-turn-helix transcriptional regulator [Paraburkholderia sp. Se-20369]
MVGADRDEHTSAHTTCPVTRALEIVGNRWSLLIVRDVFDGVRRFGALQRHLGIASNILQDRLQFLIQKGVLEVVPASDGSTHLEYITTRLGEDLFPVIVTLRQWAECNLYRDGERYALLLERVSKQRVKKVEPRLRDGTPMRPANTMVCMPPADR